jgi:Secretin and TonB N terminus short domain
LASALDAYSAATGLQIVYDGTLATGLRSKSVTGSMMPEAALRDLLDGTGLVAVYAADAFTIVPAHVQSHPTATLDNFMPYLAAVQGSIEQAFCQSRLTRPGGYRIKFKFWIGSDGNVLQPQLLGSTDNAVRDDAIMRSLAGLAIRRRRQACRNPWSCRSLLAHLQTPATASRRRIQVEAHHDRDDVGYSSSVVGGAL